MKQFPYVIKAVLFDFDGTLTQPDSLDLGVVKKAVGCPEDSYLLEYIEGLTDENDRSRAVNILETYEMEAARDARPNPGAENLVKEIKACGLPVGILSRNCRRSIEIAFDNFGQIRTDDFDLILTRDDPIEPKPSGDGVLHAAGLLGVVPGELLLAGDFILDIESGERAGALTVFLRHPGGPEAPAGRCDFVIDRLEELSRIVRLGVPLPAGKLPNDLLHEFLYQFDIQDPSVLVKPGIGEDTAAVDVENEQVLILKSDPITFATDSIADYAVLVNANDIATSGALPRWFLTTLMFPVGTSASIIRQAMLELDRVCRDRQITLCGGHTEITDAVTRPVVTGMMVGTVKRVDLIDKSKVTSGQKILLTKAVAVEGTAIIAREFGQKLAELGMKSDEIADCRNFLYHLSILEEAAIACDVGGVTAMHDVTEGGLATALEELSFATGQRIRVDLERVPIFPETRKIGHLLSIDPLGLIGSGSLLICCSPTEGDSLIDRLKAKDIRVTTIGVTVGPGQGIEAVDSQGKADWPKFKVDEITKLF